MTINHEVPKLVKGWAKPHIQITNGGWLVIGKNVWGKRSNSICDTAKHAFNIAKHELNNYGA